MGKKLIKKTTPKFSKVVTVTDAIFTPTINKLLNEEIRIKEEKEIARQEYRKKLSSYYQMSGQPDISFLLSDEYIDNAMLMEMNLANQGYITQDNRDYTTQNNRNLANLYSTVSNFYSALGSPNIMPMTYDQVINNPYVAEQLLNFGYTNPALMVLLTAAPTGPSTGVLSATGKAFLKGILTAKPLLIKTIDGTGRAIKAGGQTVVQNVPKVAGNLIVQGVPIAAAAETTYNNENENGNGVGAFIGGAAALGLASRLGWNWYKRGNPFKFKNKPEVITNLYVYSPDKRVFTWERPKNWINNTKANLSEDILPNIKAEWNKALGDATKEVEFKTKYGLTTKQGRKEIPWSNEDVAIVLNNNDLSSFKNVKNPNNYVLTGPTPQLIRGAQLRNFGRFSGAAGLGAVTATNLYNSFVKESPEENILYTSDYEETDNSVENNVKNTNDTIIAIPRNIQTTVIPNVITFSENQ